MAQGKAQGKASSNGSPTTHPVHDTEVDLLVVGSGTGLAAALSAHEQGLSVLIVEKSAKIGGSTARSGGAYWIPANPALVRGGSTDTLERGHTYLEAVVGDSAPRERWQAYLHHGVATIEMLERTTPLKLMWSKGYSDYHPESPGGDAAGRSCESRPFNAAVLGADRGTLRGGVVEAPVPMPVTGMDYKWMNLVMRKPGTGVPKIARRAAQGIGGLALGREYLAGGQALAAGLFAGVLGAGIPFWTEAALVDLTTETNPEDPDEKTVTGAVIEHGGRRVTVRARRGVVLSAGGFDHNLEMRHEFQSERLGEWSLGAESNTGDAINLAASVGADLTLMDQSWWFPAIAPTRPGSDPKVLLAERSLPGSLIVNQDGERFINESVDYMSFGQRVLALERAGTPVRKMWLVFDQTYRNSYVFAGAIYPRMKLPGGWFKAGIAHHATSVEGLAASTGLPAGTLTETLERFNRLAGAGIDDDFGRGNSAYDRYYGDPTHQPNPNLRPLGTGSLYAVQIVIGDLGTCGGVVADEHGRAMRADGSVVQGLYAIGNSAGNVFGSTYPGAGATIGQGLVYGHIVAAHAAGVGRG